MKKIIVANWKMNPDSLGRALRLARNEDFKNVVIAPPFPFLSAISKIIKKARLGAQDTFWIPEGAYTGEVSAHQLKHLKVQYVIVGHSERRALGETDLEINRKVKTVWKEGLTAILCVGEPWRVRKKGLAVAKRFVREQLKKDLKQVKSLVTSHQSLVIAYEPVWAIGTGRSDKPRDTAEMAKFIKNLVNVRVLYGGSVTAKNAALFLKQKEIGGALVGGASLRPAEFKEIARSAQ